MNAHVYVPKYAALKVSMILTVLMFKIISTKVGQFLNPVVWMSIICIILCLKKVYREDSYIVIQCTLWNRDFFKRSLCLYHKMSGSTIMFFSGGCLPTTFTSVCIILNYKQQKCNSFHKQNNIDYIFKTMSLMMKPFLDKLKWMDRCINLHSCCILKFKTKL